MANRSEVTVSPSALAIAPGITSSAGAVSVVVLLGGCYASGTAISSSWTLSGSRNTSTE